MLGLGDIFDQLKLRKVSLLSGLNVGMDTAALQGDCTICPNLALYRYDIQSTAHAYLCSVEMYCRHPL